MALDQSALLEVLDALRTADAGERITQACEIVYQALIDAELTAKIGAALHERTESPIQPAQRLSSADFVDGRRGSGVTDPQAAARGRSSRRCWNGAAGSISACSRW